MRSLPVLVGAVLIACSHSPEQPSVDAAPERDVTREVDAAGGRGLDCAVCRGGARPCVCTLIASPTAALRDGPLASAGLLGPLGLAVGASNALYVADWFAVRRIAGGRLTTVAGRARGGYRDGRAADALFDGPADVAVFSNGDVIVADEENNRVRLIRDSQVWTIAGGDEGYRDGPAATARFHSPSSVAIGPGGAIYVLDSHNRRIRRIEGTTVTTVAGNGETNCKGFNDPALEVCLRDRLWSLTATASGTVYFTDDHRVRTLAGGWVRILAGDELAGSDDGPTADPDEPWKTPGLPARFHRPVGLAVDSDGRIFVADSGNHVIRLIEKGRVSTYAGTGERGGHDGPAREVAQFNDPQGLAIDSKGRLYVSELYPRRIRVILPE